MCELFFDDSIQQHNNDKSKENNMPLIKNKSCFGAPLGLITLRAKKFPVAKANELINPFCYTFGIKSSGFGLITFGKKLIDIFQLSRKQFKQFKGK